MKYTRVGGFILNGFIPSEFTASGFILNGLLRFARNDTLFGY